MTLRGMDQPSLYERIGGAAGVEAVVRALHRCAWGDPNSSVLTEEMRVSDIVDADVRALARVLDGEDDDDGGTGIAPWRFGVLLSRRGVVVSHLRDALWLLGMSSALVEEVTAAVVAVTVVDVD